MKVIYHDGSSDLPYKKEPDEYITVSYCDISDHRPPHNFYDMHITERKNGREDYYALFVAEGLIEITLGDKETTAKKGDLILCFPNIPHKIVKKRTDNPINYWMHFNGYAIPELLSQCGIHESGVYSVGSTAVISDIFRQMILAQRLAKSSIHINAIFMKLLSEIALRNETMLPSTLSGYSNADKIIKGIIQMEWEYRYPRKISEYAKLCGMSPGMYSVAFKKATGKTPQKFIEDVKIRNACELLTSTTLTISLVAESSGFRDPLYFSRVFSRNIGMSPTEYRNRRTRGEDALGMDDIE